MPNIDIHAHIVPENLIEAARSNAFKDEFPSIKFEPDGETGRFKFGLRDWTRVVRNDLVDLQARIHWLDERGIDIQILSGWLDIFGYDLPPDEGERWSNYLNDCIKQICEQGNARFAGLCSVPLRDGAIAARVLKAALSNGLKGAMIGTRGGGGIAKLDDPRLSAFWSAADDAGAVLYLHPLLPENDDRLDSVILKNTVGRPADAIITIGRLLYAGFFTRYRNVKIILSHGGCGADAVMPRMQRGLAVGKGLHDPLHELRQAYFDSVVFDPDALRRLHTLVGDGRIMMGSDCPFPIGDPQPSRVIETAFGPGSEARQAMLGTTAAEIFGL